MSLKLTPLQMRTAEAILNIFETGQVRGDYGAVTVIPGDRGHLSYGRAQATLVSGNLATLLDAYTHCRGALSATLRPWVERAYARDVTLDTDTVFHELLEQAASDFRMRNIQDAFFGKFFWEPALRAANRLGLTHALSAAVVLDSCVHGSLRRIRERTNTGTGALEYVGEETWICAYVATRRNWLANHRVKPLRNTVYRMDTFQELMRNGNWTLALPMRVRGTTLDEHALVKEKSSPPSEEFLKLATPYMRGPAVRRLQRLLGLPASQWDGVFGPITDRALRAFQRSRQLAVTGVADAPTWEALQPHPMVR